MYERASQAAGASAPDLGTVANLARKTFDELLTFRFRAQVPVMEYVSLLIENALLLRAHRSGRVYVGFESLSHMEPVTARYLRIADLSERVYVFGRPDWQPPRHPHLKQIKLTGDMALAREWFVVAHSPAHSVALVGRDEDPRAQAGPAPEARYFRAVKSHDAEVVKQLAAAAEALIDAALTF